MYHSNLNVYRHLFPSLLSLLTQQYPPSQPQNQASDAMPQSLPFHTPQAHHDRIHSAGNRAAYQDRPHGLMHALPVKGQHGQPDSKIAAAEDSDEGYERRWCEAGWSVWVQAKELDCRERRYKDVDR